MLDSKRILIILICVILIIVIIIGVSFYLKQKDGQKKQILEYIPEEEISEEQMRQTMVSLYFKNGK